jgi:hypothetical protein
MVDDVLHVENDEALISGAAFDLFARFFDILEESLPVP